MVRTDLVYGRTSEEWEQLSRTGLEFLVERARLGRPTSYTEFSSTLERRTGLRRFDFERADERAAMGHLLGMIVERNRPETGLMISALVNYLDANDAGPGFYTYAQQLGMLRRGARTDEKWEFWATQVATLYRFYAR